MKSFLMFNFLLYSVRSSLQIDSAKAGPYDMKIRLVTECPNVGKGLARFTFKMKRVNRSAMALDANITTLISIDDSFSLLFSAAQFTNGGWKENFFVKDFSHICTAGRTTFWSILKEVHKYTGLKEGYPKCPIPLGNWTIRNFILNLNADVFPIFFYNKYRSDFSLKKLGETYGCLRVFLDIVPKKRKTKNG